MRTVDFGQKRSNSRADITKPNFLGDELVGHSGVVVLGDRHGRVSVCSVWDGFLEGNSILRRNFELVSSEITSICPISESVVCLGCRDNNCYLYDFIENERIGILKGHTKDVRAVTYDSNTSIMYSGSRDRTIRLWRVDTADYPQSESVSLLIGHADSVPCVCSRPKIWPNRLSSSSNDRTGRIWDLTTQKQISVLPGHTQPVYGIDLSSRGEYLATGSLDKSVCLWDAKTFAKQTTVNVGEMIYSIFCAQKRPNSIVVGARRHSYIYDPRNLSRGAVNMWGGGEQYSHIVEIDSNRFVHHYGQILRNYDGQIVRKWSLSRCFSCCYVEFEDEEEARALLAEEALAFAVEKYFFSIVIVLPESGRSLGFWRCLVAIRRL